MYHCQHLLPAPSVAAAGQSAGSLGSEENSDVTMMSPKFGADLSTEGRLSEVWAVVILVNETDLNLHGVPHLTD